VKLNPPLLGLLDLELDLSFTGASQDVLEQLSDQSPRAFLIEAEPWEKDLRAWIQFIRCDQSFTCPELVRQTLLLSMGLQFTDDSDIAALNSSWRQKPEKTDVLSFPVFDENIVLSQEQSLELGDIVVSLPTAEHQAKEQNHSLMTELRWLVSHGLLHLLGWDHPTSHRLKEMLCYQEQLLCINGNLPIDGDKKEEIDYAL